MKKYIHIVISLMMILTYGNSTDKIKKVKYNPNDVLEIRAKEGLLTIVEFDDDETVLDGSTGFNEGWTIKQSGNVAYITPKPYLSSIGEGEDGETVQQKSIIYPNAKDWKTNFFIRTNKRLYVGDISLSNTRNNYKIKMKYPQEEYNKNNEAQKKKREKLNNEKIAKELDRVSVPRNWDYYKKVNKRSSDIVPNYVYDDGKFTYFGFDRTKKMPAIFIKDGEDEFSTNSHTKKIGRYYVKIVHKTAKVFFLRSGRKLVGVLNSGYHQNPNFDFDTTSNPKIKRVLKR